MNADQDAERAGLLVQATQCPLIRAAYATGNQAVIARTEEYHPPKHCTHVKAAEAAAAKAA